MGSLLLRWFLSALALLAVAYLYPGVRVDGFFAAAVAALVLGLVNAVVRPILVVLTLAETVGELGRLGQSAPQDGTSAAGIDARLRPTLWL